MSREIKFRGKRVDNGEWACGYVVQTKDNTYICYAGQYDDDLFFATTNILNEVIPETVGQHTGLKDSKRTEEYPEGQEIYEGDIVSSLKHNEFLHTNTILWRSGMFWFGNWNWYEFLNIFRGTEVIGNIHENPELLKGGTPNV